jgi:hypothetical protein
MKGFILATIIKFGLISMYYTPNKIRIPAITERFLKEKQKNSSPSTIGG